MTTDRRNQMTVLFIMKSNHDIPHSREILSWIVSNYFWLCDPLLCVCALTKGATGVGLTNHYFRSLIPV